MRDDLQYGPLKIGAKVRLKKDSYWIAYRRIKSKHMVHRLLKKPYVPYFIITQATVDNEIFERKFTLEPYNF